LLFPTPCGSPGGGGSLGQPKIFRCGSLCCCVGDGVVGHCHLYPLYSWQDILLTFAEMEFDSTTMFPPGTNVMFIRSTGEPVLAQVVGHSEHGDAYRRISYECDGKTINFCACKCACKVVVRSPGGPSSLGWGKTGGGGGVQTSVPHASCVPASPGELTLFTTSLIYLSHMHHAVPSLMAKCKILYNPWLPQQGFHCNQRRQRKVAGYSQVVQHKGHCAVCH
jgi:hypothetical protein